MFYMITLEHGKVQAGAAIVLILWSANYLILFILATDRGQGRDLPKGKKVSKDC